MGSTRFLFFSTPLPLKSNFSLMVVQETLYQIYLKTFEAVLKKDIWNWPICINLSHFHMLTSPHNMVKLWKWNLINVKLSTFVLFLKYTECNESQLLSCPLNATEHKFMLPFFVTAQNLMQKFHVRQKGWSHYYQKGSEKIANLWEKNLLLTDKFPWWGMPFPGEVEFQYFL